MSTFYWALKLIYQDNQLLIVLSKNASHDYLTGLLNQRMYEADFHRQLKIARQQATPLSLVAFDIDYFKEINDHHGHVAGNQVLVEVSTALKRVSQGYQSDSRLYRVGGEEFNLVLPNNDRKSAEQLALKCCETIANSVIQYKGVRISVTLSAGVSDLTQSDKQVVDLYLRADHNLYLSKQRGRNRVTVDGKTIVANKR
ncbi:diguanylate cyclase domain protein [Lentilactobacillus kisonensis DSM 19906 = JCM 15041]|uniref:Diguanylate cyclase domain protein n=2 Tax=Lentilactobacillus kisonensis TaxID=481722 RepID=A0A0R1NVA9_9LACO|nr:diguanylate cyclase domain protein [Lentilactobacillus kisonensis DSM 19906 = JCM 15041]